MLVCCFYGFRLGLGEVFVGGMVELGRGGVVEM